MCEGKPLGGTLRTVGSSRPAMLRFYLGLSITAPHRTLPNSLPAFKFCEFIAEPQGGHDNHTATGLAL